MKKRILAFILVLISVVGVFSACSGNNEKQETKKLSEMSDEELLQYLEDKDIFVPTGLTAEDIQEFVAMLEADPDHPPLEYGFFPTNELFEELRAIVKGYQNASS